MHSSTVILSDKLHADCNVWQCSGVSGEARELQRNSWENRSADERAVAASGGECEGCARVNNERRKAMQHAGTACGLVVGDSWGNVSHCGSDGKLLRPLPCQPRADESRDKALLHA